MSYLATGDAGYHLDANGHCVDGAGWQARSEFCKPSFVSTIMNIFTPQAPIKASDIPVPASKVASVKFSGSADPWRAVPALKTAAAKTAEAAPSSGMPGWVLPVAIGGGALVLVLALTRK